MKILSPLVNWNNYLSVESERWERQTQWMHVRERGRETLIF
jgi:hypothetical protein